MIGQLGFLLHRLSVTSKLLVLLGFVSMLGGPAQGASFGGSEDARKAPQDFSEYFTVEQSYQLLESGFVAFNSFIDESFSLENDIDSTDFEMESKKERLPLLKWKRVLEQPTEPNEPYSRKKHFGNWKRTKDSCVNVRGFVLIRDSKGPVKMRPNGCAVESGLWEDAYTGQSFTSAEDLDIDHFVPLKNAYISGGWKWNRQKICRYGNFIRNNYHLVPAFKSENRRKSDLTPADYLPPNEAFHCEYALRWLKIKTIWGLVMMPPEAAAIQRVIKEHKCDPAQFEMTAEELERNKAAADSDPICDRVSED